MRPIIYFLATSLDGFIARSDGGIDWLFHDQDYGFGEFCQRVDATVMGRKTYVESLKLGEPPFRFAEEFVFSNTLQLCERGTLVGGSVAEFVRQQKAKPGKAIWLIGGGELAGAFFAADAIDELIVFVHPVLLGRGLPLASGMPHDVHLRLTNTQAFDSGLLRIDYQVVHR